MQGVVLAAGKGTRLQPITFTRTKAMAPVVGKPIVERVMDTLWVNGIDDFILIVHPEDERIEQYFKEKAPGKMNVRFVRQTTQRGMADALQYAAPLIEDDFLLTACDNLVDPNYVQRMLQMWQSRELAALLTLMTVPRDKIQRSGIIAREGERIVRIVEKPAPEEAPSNIASLPLYCFSRQILQYLTEVQLSSRGEYELQDAIQMLIDREGVVEGLMIDQRMTLTRPMDLLNINRHFLSLDGDPPLLVPEKIGPQTRLITPLCIETAVRIGSDCRIGPNVYIEKGARIGDGAVIREAVLLQGAEIASGTVVNNAVMTGKANGET